MEKIEFKKDKYTKTRGGYSRFLEIKCENCGGFLALYQKDGPGMLRRMYIDRIFSPQYLVDLQKVSFKDIPNFVCPHCNHIIGIPYIFKREERPAFRLFVGVITKKVVKVK